MAASVNDKFMKVGQPNASTTLDSPGYTADQTTPITVISTSGFPTDTRFAFAIDRTETYTENGQTKLRRASGSYAEYTGIVISSTQISNVVFQRGNKQSYSSGSTTRVYIPITGTREDALVDGLQVLHNLDGSFKPGVVSTAAIANGAIQNAQLGVGAVAYTNLLTTVFSSQLQTGTNTSNAGGTINYINLGGIKLAWGVTNSLTPGANTETTYTVTFPTSFFTAVTGLTYQNVSAVGSTVNNILIGNGYNATNFQFYIRNNTNSAGVGGTVSWIAIGS